MARLAPERDTLLLLLLGAVLFLPGLGRTDLWNPDEPRYAEVAREMRLTGDYLVPRFNGELYSQKPPLLFWTMCLAAMLRGELDEVAVRLPAAVSGVLVLPVIFGIGRRLFNRRTGWIAAVVFGTCINIMLQARTAQIDMLLVLCVTLAMYGWVRGYSAGRPIWYFGFFAAAGMATLAKGPVGLLPPLLSIFAFVMVSGERVELRRMKLLAGLGLWALVVLAWLLPASLRAGPDYLQQILFKQNLARYAQPWGHLRPWYYYLEVLPAQFFPWFFPLVPAIVYGWRSVREARARRGMLFVLCWVVVTLVFFSLSPGKRTVYILTMYPGMALLIGMALDHLARDARASRHWLFWPAALLGSLLFAIAAALPHLMARRPELAVLGQDFPARAAVTLAFFGLFCAAAAWLAWRRAVVAATTCLALGSASAGLIVALLLLPPFDALKSARTLADLLSRAAKPDEPYGIYPRVDGAFVFYTGRFATELRTEERVRAFAARPGRIWLLAERDDLAKLDPPLPLVEVARDSDALQGHVLLTSPPAPHQPAAFH